MKSNSIQAYRQHRFMAFLKIMCILLIIAMLLQALYIFIFCHEDPVYSPNDGVFSFQLPPVHLDNTRDLFSAERSTELQFAGYYETARGTLLVVDVIDTYVLTNNSTSPVTTRVCCDAWSHRFWGPMTLHIDGSSGCFRESDAYGNYSYYDQLTLQPGESTRIERTWRAKAARKLVLSRRYDEPTCISHTLRMEVPDWLEITDQNLGLTGKSISLALPTEAAPDAPELFFCFQILENSGTVEASAASSV